MSEETKVGTEATTENKATETDASETKVEKTIAEEGNLIPLGTEKKEETSESSAEASEEAESSEAKTTDGEDNDDIIEAVKQNKKSGAQKRIDKLIAQNKELTERLEKLEKSSPEEGKKPYTESQLRAALKKAMEDGDSDLVMDIMQYQVKSSQDALRKEYLDGQKAIIERQNAQAREWTETVNAYGYLSDPEQPELYTGSRHELDINNKSSYLFKQAWKLYNSPDEELYKYYHQPGGQKLAVTDALTYIIRQRGGVKPNSKETQKLEKKLAKARRKTSLPAPGAEKSEEETTSTPLTDSERVNKYVEERKRHQASKMGLG